MQQVKYHDSSASKGGFKFKSWGFFLEITLQFLGLLVWNIHSPSFLYKTPQLGRYQYRMNSRPWKCSEILAAFLKL